MQEETGNVYANTDFPSINESPFTETPTFMNQTRRKVRQVTDKVEGVKFLQINQEIQCIKLNLKEYICFKP